jgi:hypothetical protein
MSLQELILGPNLLELTIPELELAFRFLANKVQPKDLPEKLKSLHEEEWEFLGEVLDQLEEQKEESSLH